MIFIKKYFLWVKIILIVSITLFVSCKTNDLKLKKVNAKIININENQVTNEDADALIKPYSDDVNQKMNKVLCYNPVAIEKKSINKFQNEIGNWMADVVFEKSNEIFNKRFNKQLDICFLNSGGIRTILPAGNITTRNAYEIMPFENEVVVLELSGKVIEEMIQFMIKEQKPHPMKGMYIFIDQNTQIKSIKIGNEILNLNKIYYVATNDYLANGGDNMTFFTKNTLKYKTDYKIRNLLIDYFQVVKEISFAKDERFIIEK